MKMISDDRGTTPDPPNPFIFYDLQQGKQYNLVSASERVRLRNDLEAIGFFKNTSWKHMYDWFGSPLFTMGMLNDFLEAIRFYGMVLYDKRLPKNGPTN